MTANAYVSFTQSYKISLGKDKVRLASTLSPYLTYPKTVLKN
jgi:hypothetical protein